MKRLESNKFGDVKMCKVRKPDTIISCCSCCPTALVAPVTPVTPVTPVVPAAAPVAWSHRAAATGSTEATGTTGARGEIFFKIGFQGRENVYCNFRPHSIRKRYIP